MSGETYPIMFDLEGGVSIPHIPTIEEKSGCVYAHRAGVGCLSYGDPKINCGDCFVQPIKTAMKSGTLFVRSSGLS